MLEILKLKEKGETGCLNFFKNLYIFINIVNGEDVYYQFSNKNDIQHAIIRIDDNFNPYFEDDKGQKFYMHEFSFDI